MPLRASSELNFGISWRQLHTPALEPKIVQFCLGRIFIQEFAWGSKVFLEEVFGSLILLGAYNSKLFQIAWGLGTICSPQSLGEVVFRIFLASGRQFLTLFLLGVWLGVDLLGALRQGCDCL